MIADYKEDIRKYAEGIDQTRILNVFNHIPVQLAKDNKKFQISKVASGARFRDYRGCVEWLDDAGMVNICYCLNFPELPLQGNYDDTKYKIYFADSGLLVAMLDEEAQEDLRTNKNLGVYKGALYENVVGEALVKAGYKLYYYKRDDSTLEQDFFVRTASALIPVEVKAKNGTAKSIPVVLLRILPVALRRRRYAEIYTFPYFCAFLLKRYLASGSRIGCDRWFCKRIKRRVREQSCKYSILSSGSTVGGYHNLIYRHILPGMERQHRKGYRNLISAGRTGGPEDTVTSFFYDSLRGQGLSARSVWCIHLLLRRCMDEAARDQRIPYNPVRLCREPKQKRIKQLPCAWDSSSGI